MTTMSCKRLQGCRTVSATRVPRPRTLNRFLPCAQQKPAETAQNLSRRAAFLLSASPLLLASAPARSAYLDFDDFRGSGAKESMESADQARDDRLDERRRFAFESVGKMSPAEHQQRAKESYGRLQRDVKYYLDKKQLPRVSNELSLQMANLRYDLEQIANSGEKGSRKQAQQQSKQAIKALETLDLYARLNKPNEANEAYTDAIQKLGNIVKAYG